MDAHVDPSFRGWCQAAERLHTVTAQQIIHRKPIAHHGSHGRAMAAHAVLPTACLRWPSPLPKLMGLCPALQGAMWALELSDGVDDSLVRQKIASKTARE